MQPFKKRFFDALDVNARQPSGRSIGHRVGEDGGWCRSGLGFQGHFKVRVMKGG